MRVGRISARAVTSKTLLANDYVFAPAIRAQQIMREHAKRTHMDTRSRAAKDLAIAIEKALRQAMDEREKE